MDRYTEGAGGDEAIDTLRMSSITYRIATGPHAGRKVATLQTLPGDAGPLDGQTTANRRKPGPP